MKNIDLTDQQIAAELDRISAKHYGVRTDDEREKLIALTRERTSRRLREKFGEGVGVMAYDSNNSGGGWWLTDENWKALEDAGWTVHWAVEVRVPSKYSAKGFSVDVRSRPYSSDAVDMVERVPIVDADGVLVYPPDCYEAANSRWLGALAVSCAKAGTNPAALIREFEAVAQQNAADEGCNCCGQPHSFTWHAPDGSTSSPSLARSSSLELPEGW